MRPEERPTLPSLKLARAANVLLVTAACAFLFVSFYYLYFYVITGQREFPSPILVIGYCLLPLLVGGAVLWCLRLPPSYRINVSLFLVSIGVAAYVGELLVAYADARAARLSTTLWGASATRQVVEEAAAREGVNFDTRTGLEVILELREQGTRAMPAVSPYTLLEEREAGGLRSALSVGDDEEILPLGGIGNATTVFCNESGTWEVYESDPHGFRNPPDVWTVEVLDIAAVGDSYTQGACVGSDRSYAGVVQNIHAGTLNLGMYGNGPLTMLATIEEYLPPSRPRSVVWFYYEENDFPDLHRERRSALLMRYLEEDFTQDLAARREDIDSSLAAFIEQAMIEELESNGDPTPEDRALLQSFVTFLKLPHLRSRLGLAARGGGRQIDQDVFSDEQFALFRRVLERARDRVASWGGSLYFVYLPARDRYVHGLDYRREEVLASVAEVGLPVIDVHEVFEAGGDPLGLFPLRRFGHYNEDGHRAVAEAVLQAIEP